MGAALAKRRPDLVLPKAAWRKPWVIHCTAWGDGAEAVLRYLARYVFRVAITEGRIVTFTSPQLAWFGNGSVLGIPAPVAITLGMLVLTLLLARGSALGVLIEATGANARASELAGIGTWAVTIAAYVWCGLCSSVAGVIAAADILGADANNAGLWLELDAILAVVIGGTSLFGGRFSVILAVTGTLIIQAMNTGILLSGYRPELNLVVKAVVVIAVLLLQSPRVAGLGHWFNRNRTI